METRYKLITEHRI